MLLKRNAGSYRARGDPWQRTRHIRPAELCRYMIGCTSRLGDPYIGACQLEDCFVWSVLDQTSYMGREWRNITSVRLQQVDLSRWKQPEPILALIGEATHISPMNPCLVAVCLCRMTLATIAAPSAAILQRWRMTTRSRLSGRLRLLPLGDA